MINGGFGLVLDGSTEAEERAKMMLSWDVSNGVSKAFYICVHFNIFLPLGLRLFRYSGSSAPVLFN